MRIFNIEITRHKASDQYQRRDGNFVSRWTQPPRRNTAEWLEMFSKSPRLAVVERIASDLANVRGHLLRINPDGSETEILDHPFLDFMARPNPLYEMTSSAVWRLHEVYLLLVGESFFLIERDENGTPVELWNVPPHWVKMTPYLGNPTYQIISPGGLSMSVSVDDMFVMKQLNPLDPFMRGLGVAESIADEVEIDEYAAKFQKRFFYNDATPPIVFLMPDATPEQRDTFMARWNQRQRGVENSHRAAAISGPNVKIEQPGDVHGKDLGFIESRVAMRDAVLEHFGVPRELMGITENSNRATADAAQYIYAKNVLTPRIGAREEAINMQLLPMFGDNLVWRYDPVVPYDKEFDKKKALDAYDAGLITKNEARALLDLPDVDGGDVYKTKTVDVFIREQDDPAAISQAAHQPDTKEPEAPPGTKSDPGPPSGVKESVKPEPVVAALRQEDRKIRERSRPFESAISRHFTEQRSAIKKALDTGQTATGPGPVFAELESYLLPDGTLDPDLWDALDELDQRRIADRVAAGLLDWGAESKKLQALFLPLWKQAYEAGVELSEENYGIINVTRPEFTTAAKVNGAKRIVGIEQTTRDSIAGIIADGLSSGTSQAKLKKAILTEMDTTPKRAKLIARQETSTALATGQFDMMKAAGAKTKTWHHRPQKDPRDGTDGKVNHVALDGETVGIDETFSNGLRYPRDPEDDRPEELINCRCYLTYGGF